MGIVAYVCAYAFSKMSRYHKQDDNGGAYIFVRSAFGRFVGFLILSLNYIVIPLILSNQILMMIKANIDPQLSAAGNSEW
jgi:amino acid transporter